MGGSVHTLGPRWRTYFHGREEVAGCPRAGKVTEHQTVCPGKGLVQAGKPGAFWSWWVICSKWYFSDDLIVPVGGMT